MGRRGGRPLRALMSVWAVAALVLAMGAPLWSPGGVGAQTFTQQATLTVISQPVEVQRSSGSRETASSGITVNVGDRIFTGPGGSGTLTFFQGSEVEVAENSEIMVQQMEQRGGAGGASTVGIGQAIGSTISRVTSLLNPASRFQVTTPSAVAVVRGTELTTTVDANKLQLFTCANTLGTCDVTSGGQTQKLKAGESTFIFPPPPTPVALPGQRTGVSGDQSGGQDASFQDQKPATPISSDQLQSAIRTAEATFGATHVLVTLTPIPGFGTATPAAGAPSATPSPGPGTPSATAAVPSSTPTAAAPSATPTSPPLTPSPVPPTDTPQPDVPAAAGESPTATMTATATVIATPSQTATITASPTAHGTPTRAAMGVCTTHVSGTISTSTTWGVSGSPYCLTGTVTVATGQELLITSYVDVRFDAGAKLVAATDTGGNNARITAVGGSIPGEVRFMANTASPTPGYWAGIEVQDNCPATSEQRNLFSYVRIEHAATALTGRDAMVQLSNGTVTNVVMGYAGVAGACSNQDFAANVATLNTTGASITDEAGKLTLTGVTATSTGGRVIGMTTADLYASGSSLNNSASGSVEPCVVASDATGSIYIDSTPLTCRGGGIEGGVASVTYRSGTLSAAGGAGVAGTGMVQVEMATVTASGYGVDRSTGTGGVTVTSSSVTSSGSTAISARGSGALTVTDSQLSASNYGIDSTSVSVTFSGAAPAAGATPVARIVAGGYGINTSGAAITVQNASIAAGQYGLNINSSNSHDIQVTNSKLTQSGGAGGYGVNINGSGGNISLTDTIIDGFLQYGVNLGPAGNISLTNTQVLSPGQTGINLNSSGTISLTNSVVYRPNGYGVSHNGTSGAISLSGSTVSSRSEGNDYGIYANNGLSVSLMNNSTVRSVNSSGAEAVGGNAGIHTGGGITMNGSTVKLRGSYGAQATSNFFADAASGFTGNAGSGAIVPVDSVDNFTPGTYSGNGNGNVVEIKGQLTSARALGSAYVYGIRSSVQLGSGAELAVGLGAQLTVNGGGAVVSPSAAGAVSSCTTTNSGQVTSTTAWTPTTMTERRRVSNVEVVNGVTLTVDGMTNDMPPVPAQHYLHLPAGSYFRTQATGTISVQPGGGTVRLVGQDCTPP